MDIDHAEPLLVEEIIIRGTGCTAVILHAVGAGGLPPFIGEFKENLAGKSTSLSGELKFGRYRCPVQQGVLRLVYRVFLGDQFVESVGADFAEIVGLGTVGGCGGHGGGGVAHDVGVEAPDIHIGTGGENAAVKRRGIIGIAERTGDRAGRGIGLDDSRDVLNGCRAAGETGAEGAVAVVVVPLIAHLEEEERGMLLEEIDRARDRRIALPVADVHDHVDVVSITVIENGQPRGIQGQGIVGADHAGMHGGNQIQILDVKTGPSRDIGTDGSRIPIDTVDREHDGGREGIVRHLSLQQNLATAHGDRAGRGGHGCHEGEHPGDQTEKQQERIFHRWNRV